MVKPRLIVGGLFFLLCGCHGPDSGGNFPPTKIYLSEQSHSDAGETIVPLPILVWARIVDPQQKASSGTITFEENSRLVVGQWYQNLPARLSILDGAFAPYDITLHDVNRNGIGTYVILSGQW